MFSEYEMQMREDSGGGTKDNKCCSQVWEDLGSCPKSLKY